MVISRTARDDTRFRCALLLWEAQRQRDCEDAGEPPPEAREPEPWEESDARGERDDDYDRNWEP